MRDLVPKSQSRPLEQSESRAAMQYKASGEDGSLWKFIKEVIQGVGYSDFITHFTNLYQFKIECSNSMVSDYTKFVDSIDAIKSRYPANGDEVLLWQVIVMSKL